MRVFAAKGPDAAVIDDFIREAGIARGTFYNYFTRTDELLGAVSRALEDQLMHAIEHAMADLDDPVERLAAGMRLWLRWARTDRTGCAFVVRSRFRGPLVEHQLAVDLQAGRAAGLLVVPDVAVARDLLVGTVLESMNRMLTVPMPESRVDEIVALILRGLGVAPRRIASLLRRPVRTAVSPRAAATAPSSRR